jgi:SAM-dependent methyltransferase
MEPYLIDELASKEAHYWWHRVRRFNLSRHLCLDEGSVTRLLEIGCGPGANLRELAPQAKIAVGIDREIRALSYCRDLAPVQGDALFPLPFVDAAFGAVMMVDILEHLAELGVLVEEVARVLRPGGAVVVMVPSGPGLWSYWDEMHGHYRRFNKNTLSEVFTNGWRLRSLEYSFSWMYPVVWAYRRVMQRRRRPPMYSDFVDLPSVLNELLVATGRFEGRLQRYVPAPFGTSLCGLWSKDSQP